MTSLRAKKTTKNADDVRVLFAGILGAIIILIGSAVMPRLTEHRWYRDVTSITPFHSVTLLYSQVQDARTIIVVGGSMIKRRCEFHNLYGYIYADNGLKYRVAVDTSVEDRDGASGNRPPSDHPENWGPWSLSTKSNPNFPISAIPTAFEIIVEHKNCPTVPKTQRNVFMEGAWIDYVLPTNDSVDVIEKTIRAK